MNLFPKKLQKKLDERSSNGALRRMEIQNSRVDFSSNDYLGFSISEAIYEKATLLLKERKLKQNGATGSRLLSGNYSLFEETEEFIASFHKAEAALLFNSGYDANIGLFSSVPQRGDLIFYDELSHASIRDGITMSKARGIKFKHNNIEDLKAGIARNQSNAAIYIVTESVFSMDGDSPDLQELAAYCKSNNYFLIIDEAHALGVMGKGKGVVQELGLEANVFARIMTFGKGLGCHGAVILGSQRLKEYLTNFSRSFIYTTALPPHSVATIFTAYRQLEKSIMISPESNEIITLHRNIAILRNSIDEHELEQYFIKSESAIQCCIIPGNEKVRSVAEKLGEKGFDVKPILSPTVPEGRERLRICVHSYNSPVEIKTMISYLHTLLP
ncbi:8-amino-7-oxononanoate synthase [Ulvibacter sp. MAR_2010_11]|uniref:aminotransferase class I/II-fold pyridoxal phosphate-dependent enzyme n=1 Tax=Ulvibacter sp. MAR_2010_11 TaxID=1250229 RepID=UPI000C2CBCD8|nr:8-amino-7-oxononanoate synthase [Ulvibacter sp. MAR_2010_11]PKA82719.1 8-amino-7-oxononanoate synthase [Ulvibacter sp. MAR_2010_11]